MPHVASNRKDCTIRNKKEDTQNGLIVGSFATDNAAKKTGMRPGMKSDDEDAITLGCGANIPNVY